MSKVLLQTRSQEVVLCRHCFNAVTSDVPVQGDESVTRADEDAECELCPRRPVAQ